MNGIIDFHAQFPYWFGIATFRETEKTNRTSQRKGRKVVESGLASASASPLPSLSLWTSLLLLPPPSNGKSFGDTLKEHFFFKFSYLSFASLHTFLLSSSLAPLSRRQIEILIFCPKLLNESDAAIDMTLKRVMLIRSSCWNALCVCVSVCGTVCSLFAFFHLFRSIPFVFVYLLWWLKRKIVSHKEVERCVIYHICSNDVHKLTKCCLCASIHLHRSPLNPINPGTGFHTRHPLAYGTHSHVWRNEHIVEN